MIRRLLAALLLLALAGPAWAAISAEGAAAASSYTGVDQTTPVRASASDYDTTGSTSIDVTSVAGDLVVDALGEYNQVPTPGGSQTQVFVAAPNGAIWGAGSYQIAAGTTTTMSWSHGGTAWVIAAASFRPVGTLAHGEAPVPLHGTPGTLPAHGTPGTPPSH
jgi:hypothetical protein